MIIETKLLRYLLLIFTAVNLINCNTMEPDFKVIGDTSILQDVKINLEIIRQEEYPNNESAIVTLYNKGKSYRPEIENAYKYKVYFSYKNSSVTVLKFENVMQWANDYINHLYVFKENEVIYIQYIGRKSEIEKRKGFKSTPAISLQDFYEKENITKEEEKQQVNDIFFKFYDPIVFKYSRLENSISK